MAASEEELYSDDELDNIPADELADAERNAVSLTQLPVKAHPSSEYGQFELDDDNEEVFELLDSARPSPTVQDSTRVVAATNIGSKPRTPWHPSRAFHELPLTQTAQIIKPEPTQGVHLASVSEQEDVYMGNMEVREEEAAGLKEANEQLLKDLEGLRFQLQKAEAAAQAKAGEISIVRSNLSKTIKETERQYVHFQQLQSAEEAKYRAELEALRLERDNALTQIKFFKQETTADAQAKRRQKSLGNLASPDGERPAATIFRSRSSPSPFSTPKKVKSLALRDGFEDEEITYISPTKAQADRRRASFVKPIDLKKRKRGDESPSLQVSQSLSRGVSVGSVYEEHLNEGGAPEDREAKPFTFLQTMLNHKIDADHSRTIEELAQHQFPSQPSLSVSSIILDKLPVLQAAETKSFPTGFCETLTELCQQCLEEKHFDPVNLLLDWVVFAAFTTPACIEEVMAEIVRMIQLVADVNLIPLQKANPSKCSEHVDIIFCLELLIGIASNCLAGTGDIHMLWHGIRIDLIMMCLGPLHEFNVIQTAIKLLNTGVFKSGFGPIDSDKPKAVNEDFLIEMLGALLVSCRNIHSSDYDLQMMRLDIIQFFAVTCFTVSGSEALARHPKTIGRMFCLVSDEIDNLYSGRRFTRRSARIINDVLRILQFLNLNHEINFQAKLSSFPGGSHKYLVALTRLTFSQTELLEAGIEEEVTVCAQDILEKIISPEEGDSLYEAFEGKR